MSKVINFFDGTVMGFVIRTDGKNTLVKMKINDSDYCNVLIPSEMINRADHYNFSELDDDEIND